MVKAIRRIVIGFIPEECWEWSSKCGLFHKFHLTKEEAEVYKQKYGGFIQETPEQ